MTPITAEELLSGSGRIAGTSPWMTVTQDMIDTFADATHDHQFIHIDEERARAETPFGGTIAHGFLSLSLLSKFYVEALPRVSGIRMGINYGFEKVRFLMPVRAGSRVRGHFKLVSSVERNPGEILSTHAVTVEIEGVEKPALAAEWINMILVDTDV